VRSLLVLRCSKEQNALHTLIHQRHLAPSCGGHAPTAERTLHPARMLTESLTPRPELENSQGQSEPRMREAARPSFAAALAPNRATRPYLPRLSSNRVMRRQNLASTSSHTEGNFGGGAGEDVVGIATLVARYLVSDLFCRSVRRVITSLVIAGSSVRTKPYRRFTMTIASRPLASEL
jgi:hypothetical protein